MSHVLLPILAFVLIGAFAAYHRLRLATWVALLAVALVACWLLGAHRITVTVLAIASLLVVVPLLIPAIRKPLLVAPLLNVFRRILPPLSQTERIALETGSVGFEG